MADTVAILLAAGESRRMGRSKALLPWQGTTLLEHQVTALLEGGVDRVVVVLGHLPETLKPIIEGRVGVEVTVNANYTQGKITSIKTGLRLLDESSLATILILNVDQPRSAATIRTVLRRHGELGGLVTIPTFQGKGGHPIVLDPALLPELINISDETMGIKAVVRAHADATYRTEMADGDVLWDLNTPDQYQKAILTDD